MEAGKKKIKQIFENNICYIIPTFQRPYVWEQEKQWEPLWEDVRNLTENYIDNLNITNNKPEAEKETGNHFLGAIVLQQIPTATAEIGKRDIIDGQQRMITLQILIDAAQEVIENEGYGSEAKRLSKYVLNDPDIANEDDCFKIWPSSGDRDAFRSAMKNDLNTDGHEESLIVQAHDFFKYQIVEWLNSSDTEEKKLKVEALFTSLLGLLELVVIDLSSGDDAYLIFETLNARGTPLLASDLIKNFILQQASADGLSSDRLYEKYWKHLEGKWWREEVRQGRLRRPRIDVFLNYWLISRKLEEVKSHTVFPAFKEYYDESGLPITEMVEDINKVGNTYERLESIEPFSLEGTFLYRWDTMQAGVFTPLILELFTANEHELVASRRNRALKTIESYLVRRMICRMTTKDYNRLVMELLPFLSGKLHEADDEIIEFLNKQEADSRLWPNDGDLKNAILELPLYRLLTKGRLRIILEAIEEELRTGKTEDEYVRKRGKLTIEHILPIKWSDNWPLEVGDNPEEYLDRVNNRNRLVHTLGNLTLLTDKLNSSQSNSEWDKKKQSINDHSVLLMSKRLLADYGTTDFSEAQIKQRSAELAKIVSNVWPAPPKI